MFEIILQKNDSEPNRLDKELTDIATVSGTLKQQTSIIDPVIMIDGDLSDYTECNYLTISTFGRKYFVKNITSLRAGLIELSCHVDVLGSFRSEIRENHAITKRQERAWNLYLNDGSFKVYQNPDVITKPFPSGFSGTSYVLAVAGSEQIQNVVTLTPEQALEEASVDEE